MDKGLAIVGTTTALCVGAVAFYFRHDIIDFFNKSINGSYFTIDELCKSSTATAKGIDNTPTKEAKKNLKTLINKCLNPVREIYGKPMLVSSGYRSEALNKAVGGVSNSQHLTGNAVDVVPSNGGNLADIFKAVVEFGKYDQLIYETNNKGSKWVHISYDKGNQRNQMLSYKNGKYTDISSNWKSVVV